MNISFTRPHKLLKSCLAAWLLLIGFSTLSTGCANEDPNQITDEQRQEISGFLVRAESARSQFKYRAALVELDAILGIDANNLDALNGLAEIFVIIGDGDAGQQQLNEIENLQGSLNVDQQLLKIKALILQNKLKSAEQLTQQIQPSSKKQQLELALLKAEVSLTKQQPEAASNAYLKAQDIDNGDVRPIIGLAKVALAKNDKSAIEQYTERAASLAANDTDYLIWKGRLAIFNEQWSEAEEAFVDALIELSQTDIMTAKKYYVITSLVNALQRQNKLDAAETYLKTISDSGPGQLKTRYDEAVLLYQSGDFARAEEAFREIMRTAPSHKPSGTMLGIIRYQLGDLVEAERYLNEFLDLESAPAGAKKILAMTRLRLNQVQGAQDVLNTLNSDDNQQDADLLALLGVSSLVSGDTQAGIASIQKALEKEPERSNLRLRLAEFYSLNDNLDDALATLLPIAEDDPNKSAALALEVTALLRADQAEKARERVDNWIKKRQDDVLAYIVSGGLAISEGKTVAAQQAFNKALTIEPGNATALLNLARMDINDNNYDQAKKRYGQLVAADPSNVIGLRGIMAIANEQNQAAKAIETLQGLLTDNPNNTNVQFVLAEYYLSENNIGEAFNQAQSGLAKTPDSNYGKQVLNALYYRRAIDAVRGKEFAKAEEDAGQALAVLPDHVPSLTLLAGLAVNSEKIDTALEIATKLQTLRPNESIGFEVAGDIYQQQKNSEQAIKSYQAGFDVQRNESVANKLVNQLVSSNKGAEAVALLQKWTADEPRNLSARLLLASTYEGQSLDKNAIAEYEKILESAPNNPFVLNNLAWLYFQTGEPKALNLAQKAAELAPENGSVLDTYGWLLFNRGELKDALAVLEKAAQLEPQRADILEHFAAALDKNGRPGDAKSVLERVKQLTGQG